MEIETYFEEQKGITVDAARNGGAKYTAIDMCRFAQKYHESEVKKINIGAVIHPVCPRCKSDKITVAEITCSCDSCRNIFNGQTGV